MTFFLGFLGRALPTLVVRFCGVCLISKFGAMVWVLLLGCIFPGLVLLPLSGIDNYVSIAHCVGVLLGLALLLALAPLGGFGLSWSEWGKLILCLDFLLSFLVLGLFL